MTQERLKELFKDKLLAAQAYDAAAQKHYGEFACGNF